MTNKLDLAETPEEKKDATVSMLLDALEADREDRRKTRRLNVICATICAVSLLLFAGVLGVLASGVQIETTTTEETTQSVEGDSATINNGEWEQYNDNATKNGGDN